VLGFVLLLSLCIYLFTGPLLARKVLFFPDERTKAVRSELHYVISRGSFELDVEELVKEMLLGPYSLELNRPLSRQSSLRTCILTGSTLNIDFTEGLLFPDNGLTDLPWAISFVEKSLRFNYPSLKEIHFSVGGLPVTVKEEEVEKKKGSEKAPEDTKIGA
jgi:hypothetical protein